MNLSANIWKLFFYITSQRRHYIPILSIYFLTLPDTTAQQIGLYTGIGYVISFFLEIPSGYISDKWGHKNALVLSKILMIGSTLTFIIGTNVWHFAFGSALLSAAWAFNSGTVQAFVHETLESLNREKEFTKVMSRLRGYASIVSMVLIIALPFFTKISIEFPLKINLVIDLLGFIFVCALITPPSKYDVKKKEKRITKKGVLPFIILTSVTAGFVFADSAFKYIYLESLQYPIILIGLVMGLSRLVWVTVAHYAHILEKYIGPQKLLRYEIIFFPVCYALIAYLNNPYVVGGIFSLMVGYMWGRSDIFTNYLLENYLHNKKFKATIISLQGQVREITKIGVVAGVSTAMGFSYKLGFGMLAAALFIILLASYLWWVQSKSAKAFRLY